MKRHRSLVLSVLVVMLLAAACSDDQSASTTASTDTTASSEPADTTTTTTAAATTSSTTTTTPTDVVDVTLAHSGLVVGGGEFFVGQNGSDPEPVIAAVTVELGEPTTDSGWGPNPIAAGEYRFVQWDNGLALSFDDSEIPGEGTVRHFVSYEYPGFPNGIYTVMDGITIGSTVGETIAAVSSYRPEVGLDQYQWVQSSLAGNWVLEAGNAEFGFLCFNSGMTTEPIDDAQIVIISAGLDCTYDGE